ncbi:MAG: transcription antitermination factor NusB [Acidobacteriaceae bacterium]|nr:transcription antitermination factor NusB [Acidobacteriaceae bacterium]
MGTRRKSRELAMQMLYQGDLGKQTPEQVSKLFWPSRDEIDDETRGFAEDIYRVATARQEEIDQLIEKHAENWRIERMAAVDRNLMRAAVAEMLAYPNTPTAIIINESLEVGRRYAAPESINFLNGVLDAVARDLLKQRYSDRP